MCNIWTSYRLHYNVNDNLFIVYIIMSTITCLNFAHQNLHIFFSTRWLKETVTLFIVLQISRFIDAPGQHSASFNSVFALRWLWLIWLPCDCFKSKASEVWKQRGGDLSFQCEKIRLWTAVHGRCHSQLLLRGIKGALANFTFIRQELECRFCHSVEILVTTL